MAVWVLPDGVSYRLLVVHALATMRPGVLNKIREVVQAGAVVIGAPPPKSAGITNYPAADMQYSAPLLNCGMARRILIPALFGGRRTSTTPAGLILLPGYRAEAAWHHIGVLLVALQWLCIVLW